MGDLVKPGEAIEGDKVDGSSRKPLIPRGLHLSAVGNCYRFTAKFNVKATISTPLTEGLLPTFEPTAAVAAGSELLCDGANIQSFDQNPSRTVTMGSSTHQTNAWHFAKQTSVRIDQAHQELINAIAKRALLAEKEAKRLK